MAFLFRQTEMTRHPARRTQRVLTQLAAALARAAAERGVAVVVTNHVTVREVRERGRFLPALGGGWAHAAGTRVALVWDGAARVACLQKSPTQPRRRAAFFVTNEGVRGCERRKRAREEGAGEQTGNRVPATGTRSGSPGPGHPV